MRFFLAVVVLALAAVYWLFGLRIGYATATPLYLLNAQGQTSYPFQVYERGKLTVTGSCEGQKGSATLHFEAPDGTELSAVKCPPGRWSLRLSNVGGSQMPGIYHLRVEFKHYSGKLELTPSFD